MVLLLALLMILLLRYPREWEGGQWLYRWIVVKPAAWLAGLERKHWLYMFVGVFLAYGFAMTAPADLALLFAWDMTVYLDLVIAVWTAAAVLRVRTLATAFKLRVLAFVTLFRPMTQSHRQPTAQKRPVFKANDDDKPEPVLVRLAA